MHSMLARSAWFGSVLTLWLTGCSQPISPADDPYAGGVSYPWTYTAPPKKFTALSLTAGDNNLYYEPILAARNSWGPIEIDHSNGEQAAGDGKTLTLNGKRYTRGFGTHAGSEMRYTLEGADATCNRFTVDVGVDDEVGNKGSVVFQVYLDGQKAYDSGTMTGASATKQVDLNIAGKHELRLVVTDASNGMSYDHADWAQPLISCQATSPSLTLNQQALSVYHLHTAALKATFNNYKAGPVTLQLLAEPPEGPPVGDPDAPRFPLVLQTTSLTLSGAASETWDVVIAAPEKPRIYTEPTLFFLAVSRDGQLVNSVPVELTELPIKFTASVEPKAISGRLGETTTLTLTVAADPPLNQAAPLTISYLTGNGSCDPEPFSSDCRSSASVGPVRGDGARMQADMVLQLIGPEGEYSLAFGIDVGGITTGYRDLFYGSSTAVSLPLTVLP